MKTYKTKPWSKFQFSPLDGAQFANTSAAQITTNPKEDYKNTYNARKVAPSYTQLMKSEARSRKIRANLPYFPNQVKEKNERGMIGYSTPRRPTPLFTFL